ncbi:MAG: AI-2E family transporter [Anaerolineales bacterium]|nr:AI-2E family transporter [Anaerolineales bacterium]
MTSPESMNQSPTWGGNVKLIVGLTSVAIAAAFLIRFRTILPPLLLTLVLTYLLRPLVEWVSKATPLSWRWSVNIIFILLVILMLGSFTMTGVAVVQQFQSLINVIDRFVNDLPDMVLDFSTQVYAFGPFRLDMSQYLASSSLESLVQQLLGIVQPFLGRAGSLLGTLASGTVTSLGWSFFILMVSYFILADMGQVTDKLGHIDLPGYDTDLRRIVSELNRIWNAFLRGQIIMFTLSLVVYLVLFAVLGVRYVLAIALLAGLARFVPYVGQWMTWTVLILVTAFQKSNYFGLSTFQYVVLVVAFVFVMDSIFDNVVSPRIMGRSMGVHPAAVLIAAIIGFSLLGIVGVILAGPGLASLTMLGRYMVRKMLDLDPWPEQEEEEFRLDYPWSKWGTRLRALVVRMWGRLRRR